MSDTIVIERRFRGPQRSGNGGYTCGRVAAFVGADVVEVTLRLPPPLETPMRVEREGHGLRLLDGERLVAEAAPSGRGHPALRGAVSFARAVELAGAQPPDPDHPFPGCFACGPERGEGDGLRLRTAPRGDGVLVAPWLVRDEGPEFVWAALDCPGAYAVNPGFERGLSVLGRLTAEIVDVPSAGDECVVAAWPLDGSEGRRLHAATAVWRGEECLAWGRAVWVLVGDDFRDTVRSPR